MGDRNRQIGRIQSSVDKTGVAVPSNRARTHSLSTGVSFQNGSILKALHLERNWPCPRSTEVAAHVSTNSAYSNHVRPAVAGRLRMWSFMVFVAAAGGLCAGTYLWTKRALLAMTVGVVTPSVGEILILRSHGRDAFELYAIAALIVVSSIVSFLTLMLLSFSEDDD